VEEAERVLRRRGPRLRSLNSELLNLPHAPPHLLSGQLSELALAPPLVQQIGPVPESMPTREQQIDRGLAPMQMFVLPIGHVQAQMPMLEQRIAPAQASTRMLEQQTAHAPEPTRMSVPRSGPALA